MQTFRPKIADLTRPVRPVLVTLKSTTSRGGGKTPPSPRREETCALRCCVKAARFLYAAGCLAPLQVAWGDIFERNSIGAAQQKMGPGERAADQPDWEREGPAEPSQQTVSSEGEHGGIAEHAAPTAANPPTWHEVCKQFPDELEGLTDGDDESSQDDSEAGTLSEELQERIAAAAVSADEPALDELRREYSGSGDSLGGVESELLLQRAINKLRPVSVATSQRRSAREPRGKVRESQSRGHLKKRL